jgi:hypothetical protein
MNIRIWIHNTASNKYRVHYILKVNPKAGLLLLGELCGGRPVGLWSIYMWFATHIVLGYVCVGFLWLSTC